MSREEVIRFLRQLQQVLINNNSWKNVKQVIGESFTMAIEALEADVPDTNGGDMISRQAAISYAISGRIRTLPTSEGGENWIRTSEVRQSLLTMPSAQPVIRCKDCKHSFLHDNGEKISRICGLTRMCGTTQDDWFCADAERSSDE